MEKPKRSDPETIEEMILGSIILHKGFCLHGGETCLVHCPTKLYNACTKQDKSSKYSITEQRYVTSLELYTKQYGESELIELLI